MMWRHPRLIKWFNARGIVACSCELLDRLTTGFDAKLCQIPPMTVLSQLEFVEELKKLLADFLSVR